MAKLLGVSALRNGAFRFAPLMSRSTSAFRVRVQASLVLDVDVDYEDRDAARTLDLLRIRQNLDRRARKSEIVDCTHFKRLMGLEPTTFCMASRP
jgi:hypothetical protein